MLESLSSPCLTKEPVLEACIHSHGKSLKRLHGCKMHLQFDVHVKSHLTKSSVGEMASHTRHQAAGHLSTSPQLIWWRNETLAFAHVIHKGGQSGTVGSSPSTHKQRSSGNLCCFPEKEQSCMRSRGPGVGGDGGFMGVSSLCICGEG